MSAMRDLEEQVSASACASEAWRLLWKAPTQHILAGLMFLILSTGVPCIGTVIAGPMWVGMCSMALASFRGEDATLEQFFAPFGDHRARASWIFGIVVTVVMTLTSMVGTSILVAAVAQAMADGSGGGRVIFTTETTIAFAIMLFPIVLIAYYLFPAGFYIANGETDWQVAVRKGMAQVSSRRPFWAAFWGAMMAGHLVGMLTCCIGLIVVLPWNCIAMGRGLLAEDASLAAPTNRMET